MNQEVNIIIEFGIKKVYFYYYRLRSSLVISLTSP